MWHCWFAADPNPPTDVVAFSGTECNTSDVSWSPSQINYATAIGKYSVRYQLRGDSGNYATVNSSSTNVTLRGLDPNAVYDVEVAAVDLCGRTSGFAGTQFTLQGISCT